MRVVLAAVVAVVVLVRIAVVAAAIYADVPVAPWGPGTVGAQP